MNIPSLPGFAPTGGGTEEAIDAYKELTILREFYATWKVLHMDPERRMKLKAATRLVELSHDLDTDFPRAQTKPKALEQALRLVHG